MALLLSPTSQEANARLACTHSLTIDVLATTWRRCWYSLHSGMEASLAFTALWHVCIACSCYRGSPQCMDASCSGITFAIDSIEGSSAASAKCERAALQLPRAPSTLPAFRHSSLVSLCKLSTLKCNIKSKHVVHLDCSIQLHIQVPPAPEVELPSAGHHGPLAIALLHTYTTIIV